MRFYSEVVFPWLCDVLLRQPFVARQRQQLLASVTGNVLEIGFGTGLNLPFYPSHVRRITTVDPNPGMNRKAKQRIAASRIEVDHHTLDCERLSFADRTFDCVVSTFTLCSIDNVSQALGEVHRVLKPDGRFLFLEHGLSPEPWVQRWQRRLNWLEMHLAAGCRLDRNIKALVQAQPFANVEVAEAYLTRFPKTHGYVYRGSARK